MQRGLYRVMEGCLKPFWPVALVEYARVAIKNVAFWTLERVKKSPQPCGSGCVLCAGRAVRVGGAAYAAAASASACRAAVTSAASTPSTGARRGARVCRAALSFCNWAIAWPASLGASKPVL